MEFVFAKRPYPIVHLTVYGLKSEGSPSVLFGSGVSINGVVYALFKAFS